jgi:prepilin-type N-terminal cleavage/methylation domain-containing protein
MTLLLHAAATRFRRVTVPVRRERRVRGFTLFELVMVVMILGIVAAALVPPLGNNLYSPRLRTAANMLASDIDFCASESIAQPSAPRAVTFDTTGNKYTLLDFKALTALKHPADSRDYVNDFVTGRNAQLAGVTLQSVVSGGSPVSTVAFDAYGRPLLAADLVITLAFNGQTLAVTVKSTTGDVSITGG